MKMNKQELSLAAVLDGVLQQLACERISVVGSAQHQVVSDAQFLRLVLQNLLDNAIKYSPAGSTVTLQIATASDGLKPMLSLTVANAAGDAGVPDAAQVFQRFYRADGARSRPGAGLGLWLAQSLVRQLGSDIVFHAGDGQVRFGFMVELK
jgi:signal transduction histidine kinase